MLTELRTDAEFDALVGGSSRPSVVKVYADWCPPCAELSAVVEDLATDFRGVIDFYQSPIESWKWTRAGRLWRVKALPTLFLFTGDRLLERLEGVHPAAVLARRFGYLLAPSEVES